MPKNQAHRSQSPKSSPKRKNRYLKLLELHASKGSKSAESGYPSSPPGEGPISHSWPREWGYNHRQDIPYLKQCQQQTKRDQERRERAERLPPKPFKRITLANATQEQVINALHKAYAKDRRKAGLE